ncbi:hypothetical protein [Desulfosporosinus sp.]|uniref:TOTE conflict system archaeo-eukaryotic primase domain-containing protein n=1 Tax=Desulfosporosinus sp. TaxID=157907 RepID=UPI0025C5233D|nr:hypothetical protein [Desulfosporosinus sp.]MBC2727796.1 hypothetical protein [Desulfosporosinus sp.]
MLGINNIVVGIYPLCLDETCHFLANSVFIDEKFKPFKDQWEFMTTLRKLSEDDVESLISKLCTGNELGILKKDDQEEPQKPWDTNIIKLSMKDFPQ